MLVHDGRILLSRGPKENRVRPAIDPLFRSAAAYYGARTVGVILSGLQDDGAVGLIAIKRCGGVAIVQIRPKRPTVRCRYPLCTKTILTTAFLSPK